MVIIFLILSIYHSIIHRLNHEQRVKVPHSLCEGSSIRAINRPTGASKNTITKLLADAGRACAAYHELHVRNLKSRKVQMDEIWSFIYAKQGNVKRAKSAPVEAGDVWTWTALDADSKLLVSWLVGPRTTEWIARDLKSRLSNRIQQWR